MINHVSIGVGDLAKSKTFYDATLGPLGYVCLDESQTSRGYGKESVAFWVLVADAPRRDAAGSGLHFCFDAPSRKSVEEFHAAALSAGGRDNGKPGLREDYGPDYFAAFAVDPDGYRIEAYCAQSG